MLDAALVRIGQLIGKPPGWERVVRALAPPARFANETIQAHPQPDGYVFPVDRGTLIGWTVHFFGAYEPEVRAEIRRYLHAGAVALDIGANVGWHTLLMASRVGPGGQVYAFEPNASTRARLVAAVDANLLSQVIVDPRAVAGRTGVHGFQAPPAGHVWDGTGHLTADSRSAPHRIASITLDEFVAERQIGRIDLVKIDVEGWELAVLQGARRMLRVLRPPVVFEFDPAYVSRAGGSADDIMRCWHEADYDVFALEARRAPVKVAALGGSSGNFLARPRGEATGE
jgi:FkbM family methyltransferase